MVGVPGLSTVFWVVTALVAVLLSRNARYAVREYLAKRNRVIFSVYVTFLLILGYLLIHVTSRILDITEQIHESKIIDP